MPAATDTDPSAETLKPLPDGGGVFLRVEYALSASFSARSDIACACASSGAQALSDDDTLVYLVCSVCSCPTCPLAVDLILSACWPTSDVVFATWFSLLI